MTEVYVFKIIGDWQVLPTAAYELDFCKNEVVLRPVHITSTTVKTPDENDDKEYRIKWDLDEEHLRVFGSAEKAIKWIREQDIQEKKDKEIAAKK